MRFSNLSDWTFCIFKQYVSTDDAFLGNFNSAWMEMGNFIMQNSEKVLLHLHFNQNFHSMWPSTLNANSDLSFPSLNNIPNVLLSIKSILWILIIESYMLVCTVCDMQVNILAIRKRKQQKTYLENNISEPLQSCVLYLTILPRRKKNNTYFGTSFAVAWFPWNNSKRRSDWFIDL